MKRHPAAVGEADKRAAVSRILERHREAEDPYQERMSEDPEELLAYLERFGPQLDRELRRADLHDAQILAVWLYWRWLRHDTWVLEQGEALGCNRRAMGALVNVTTGQGVVDRIHYHRLALASTAQRAQRAERARESAEDDAQRRWLCEPHRTALLDRVLSVFRRWGPDESLDWLAGITAGTAWSPALIVAVEHAAAELSEFVAEQKLPSSHPLPRALQEWQAFLLSFRTSFPK